MGNIRYAAATLVALIMILVLAGRAVAHQPFFAEENFTPETTVSLPTSGDNPAAVLHGAGATGRHTFVPDPRASWTLAGAADAQFLDNLPAGAADDGRPPTLVEVMRALLAFLGCPGRPPAAHLMALPIVVPPQFRITSHTGARVRVRRRIPWPPSNWRRAWA
ncbi:MAG: hypothetical protein R2851_15950 [Caldilineaceae bacterium]